MAKIPDNVRDGLEAELAGIEARLEVTEDPARRETLTRRQGEVSALLGRRGKAKAEKRPASGGAEKRPG